jgi:hypothetical protein
MKVLGLIEQDLDIVSKEYVDNKVKEVSKADDIVPEGYVKLDLLSLWAVYELNSGIHKRDYDAFGFEKLLQKCITKEKTHLISPDIDVEKHSLIPSKLLDVVKANPICYIREADYLDDVYNYFERTIPSPSFKINILVSILWAALKGKGEGHTKKEQVYEDIFELLQNCIAGDGKTPIGDLKGYSGEPLSKDEAGLSQLIEENLDIYANPLYLNTEIDNVIEAILSSGSGESKNPNLKGYIKVDLPSLVMAIPSDENYKAAQTTKLSLLAMLISNASDKNAVGIFQKYQVTEFTEEMLEKIMLNDPEVYVEKESFKNVLDTVNLYSPALLEKNIFGGAIKINTSSLYMISNLLKNILPNGLKINPDVWCEKVLISCMNRDGKMVDISGKSITEVIGTEKEVYIDGDRFNDLIIKTITEDFKPVGKRKGYELMKTHYAIYLLSLAHTVRGGETEGLNQKFFKLIKDGYDVNEYNAEKTLVKDLGFEYNESAPESSYSANALSNFADKHPEIYVPTAFTEYVKGTASNTMDIVSVILNMSQYLEVHKNDPKIKIVTPNEYKINRKDPDTLYIVKES